MTYTSRLNLKNLMFITQNPEYIHNELKRVLKYGDGVDVIDEDWDNLILLDACRYNAFSDINTLDGTLESRVSRGSTSKEFIKENFSGRELHDTIYISANPYTEIVGQDIFHAVISLLNEDCWDEELQTVHPKTVVEKSIEIYEEYEDKRIIIHFMQPHQPYIGEKANEFRDLIGDEVQWWGKNNPTADKIDGDSYDMVKLPDNNKFDVSNEDVWEAYIETLDLTLQEVENLIRHIGGKTVISADHGELIGESPLLFQKRSYGHPYGVYVPQLRNVPWFIIDSEDRRTINSSPPDRYETADELDSKLKALGYK